MVNGKVGLSRDTRRKKQWRVYWQGEYDPVEGKRKTYNRYFRTWTEAEEFQHGQREKFRKGFSRDRLERTTLGVFLKDWLNTRKAELQPASIDLYQLTMGRLLDFFGKDMALAEITPKDAAVFVSKQRLQKHGREGEALSEWSRERFKRHGKTIFETAVQWRLIPTNPFKALRFKKPAQKRWHRVTVPEYKALLELSPSLRWKVFYALAYTTGARFGELFSLTWNDVDFERGRVIIANREGSPSMPPFRVKDHEARQIPVPKHTIDLLTEYQAVAPEGVPYILLTQERYLRVKARSLSEYELTCRCSRTDSFSCALRHCASLL